MFELNHEDRKYEIYEIIQRLNKREQAQGIDVLPAMRLRYAGLLKNNITAMHITHMDDVSFRVVIERYIESAYVYQDYCLGTSPEDWDGSCPIEREMHSDWLSSCIDSMFDLCDNQIEQVKHIDIFEKSYFLLHENHQIFQQETESLQETVKQLETDLSYYRVLAQDLAKYHAKDILAHVIQFSIASLEADTSNRIYGDETVNLWEEICIYSQSARSCNNSVLDDAVECACYEALKQLNKEQYIMLLMAITDFEEDYYVGGDGCPEHWHEQATHLGDGLDKLLSKVIPEILGYAVDNESETIQSWLYSIS